MSYTVYSAGHEVVDAQGGEAPMSEGADRRVRRARARLLAFLEQNDHVLPGSVVERSLRCGKANCRCHAEPPVLHGPYVQWSYTRANKRFTRWLTAEQNERYRPRIEAGRQLRDLVAELEALEISATEQAEGWDA
jgi:hypothetical protein